GIVRNVGAPKRRALAVHGRSVLSVVERETAPRATRAPGAADWRELLAPVKMTCWRRVKTTRQVVTMRAPDAIDLNRSGATSRSARSRQVALSSFWVAQA